MLRFILGGVALAVTGYGVKKYFEDESNCQEFENSVCGWIDKVEEKTDKFSDFASNAIDKLDAGYDAMNVAHSKLGTRTATIENYETIVQTKLANFDILQEEYGSADLTTLAIESQSLENTYTALYSTINKINSLSLVQYLS